MQGKTTVLIILDAFRWDYLDPDHTPFLCRRAAEGVHVRRIVSSTGFTQRAAMFTGTHPEHTDCYTMFCYDPEGSPYRPLGVLRAPLRWLEAGARSAPPLDFVERGLRHRVFSRLGRILASHAPPAFIPLHLLPLIGVSEDRVSIHSAGALGVPSIFDSLREHGLTYRFLMFPDLFGDDDAVLAATLAAVDQGHDLYLLQFSDSDALCHLHGSESEVRRKVTRELDRKLRVVFEAFERTYQDPAFIVVGDHGMMDITETIDVAAVIHGRARAARLRHGDDYLLFLDSTLARLWFLKDGARPVLEAIFEDEPFATRGRLIDGNTAARYRIPGPGRRWGERIWWASPGVLVQPDYFHPPRLVVKGMHGYDSYHEKMMGFAVVSGSRYGRAAIDSAPLVDICPTICDLVGIPPPSENAAESLVAVRQCVSRS